MMNVYEIKEKIYNYLIRDNIFPVETYCGDRSYDGDNCYATFSVNKLKRWKFGMFITFDYDYDTVIGKDKNGYNIYKIKNENVCEVSIFGEHIDYIDKFKPTAVKISHTFELTNDILKSEKPFICELEFFIKNIKEIERQPWAMKYYYYGDLDNNKIFWLLREMWFYRIELPIRNWLKKRGNYFIAKCIKLYIKAFYKKAIVDIDIVKMYDFAFPNVVLRIKVKDEYIETIGYKIWKKFCNFRGFGYCLNADICQNFEKGGKFRWRPVYWKDED